MTFFDMISFAKLFSQVTSGNMTMSSVEMETATKILKEIGDNSPNLNPMQRELYKVMVDATKEGLRGQRNG